MPIYKYSYVFLAFPIYKLLYNKVWKFSEFLNLIVKITMLSMLIRTSISLVQKFTGIVLFPTLAMEYATEGWIRNGYARTIMITASISFILTLVLGHHNLFVALFGWRIYFFHFPSLLLSKIFIH